MNQVQKSFFVLTSAYLRLDTLWMVRLFCVAATAMGLMPGKTLQRQQLPIQQGNTERDICLNCVTQQSVDDFLASRVEILYLYPV